ncbi:MAG: CpsD/CapB family tyrosine-protein kinase [Thermodesulfobacteriota bacterium]
MGKMSEVLRRSGRDFQSGQPTGRPDEQKTAKQTPLRPERAPAPAGARPPAGPTPSGQTLSQSSPGQRLPTGIDLKRAEELRLVSYYMPGSPQAKRVDILRTQLLYPFHGEPPRTIMIASAAPQEGRSLLAANLAISFARGLQQFVMVMDCHLTDPMIHELLSVPRSPGLTDFLERGASVPSIMHRTPVDKLSAIPAGSPSQRPAEILATDKMAGLIAELRARYRDRYIILDTPPVQAFDDPQVLSRLVEAIVYVVLTGETDRELALRGLKSLPEEKIMGIVLNDMDNSVVDATAVGGGLEVEA